MENDVEFLKRVQCWTGPGEAYGVTAADIQRLLDMVKEERMQKNLAYTERNRVVAALAKVARAISTPDNKVDAGVAEDPEADEGWRGVCYIDLPPDMGQVSFHFSDEDAWLFRSLPLYTGKWDGHSTEVKYVRLDGTL